MENYAASRGCTTTETTDPRMPETSRYARLSESVKIGPVTAPDRFYQVPICIGMGYALPQTLVGMLAMHAGGGGGVVCTGSSACWSGPAELMGTYAAADKLVIAGMPMKQLILPLAAAVLLCGCGRRGATEVQAGATHAAQSVALGSGIELQYVDASVRPQDDFYQHVNGKWLASFQIPPDKVSYDPWDKLIDDARQQLRAIIEGLQKHADPADPDQRKIADLYSSFMDEAAVEKLGVSPLAKDFAAIGALRGRLPLMNQPAFYEAFGVKPGDRMYLAPEQRVSLW